MLSTDDHLFSNGATCYEPPTLGLETRRTYIHLWNNTQLKHKPLTFCLVFFRPPKLLPLLFSHPFLFHLPSSCQSNPCCPPLWCKSYVTEASTCILIGSKAPIPGLSVQQHLNLEDKSQQSKISRVNYGWCANMINDMLEPFSIYCEVVSIPRAAKRLLRWRIRRKVRLSARTGQLGTTRHSGIRREVHTEVNTEVTLK